MLRLHQREQILILQAADRYPGPLADWLRAWVDTQRDAPSGAGIEIGEIPFPATAAEFNEILEIHEEEKLSKQEKQKAFLESIGYSKMDKPQRLAIRMTLDAEVKTVEKTDRLPDNQQCWIGKHSMEGDWEALDNYLWKVTGTFASGVELRKWGCVGCALAVAKAHPEAILNAID